MFATQKNTPKETMNTVARQMLDAAKGAVEPLKTVETLSLNELELKFRELLEVKDVSRVTEQTLIGLMDRFDPEKDTSWKDLVEWTPDSHNRTCLIAERGLALMLVSWWDIDIDEAAIHDHPGQKCMFRVLSGEIHEITYATPTNADIGTPLRMIGDNMVRPGTTSYIDDNLGIHVIGCEGKVVTMHLYVPGWQPPARIFNAETSEWTLEAVEFEEGTCPGTGEDHANIINRDDAESSSIDDSSESTFEISESLDSDNQS